MNRELENLIARQNRLNSITEQRSSLFGNLESKFGQNLDSDIRIGKLRRRVLASQERAGQRATEVGEQIQSFELRKSEMELKLHELQSLGEQGLVPQDILERHQREYNTLFGDETPEPQTLNISLPGGEVFETKNTRVAIILGALTQNPANTEQLSILLFGEYNSELLSKTFSSISTARRQIKHLGYEIITETTPRQRTRGQKAVYELRTAKSETTSAENESVKETSVESTEEESNPNIIKIEEAARLLKFIDTPSTKILLKQLVGFEDVSLDAQSAILQEIIEIPQLRNKSAKEQEEFTKKAVGKIYDIITTHDYALLADISGEQPESIRAFFEYLVDMHERNGEFLDVLKSVAEVGVEKFQLTEKWETFVGTIVRGRHVIKNDRVSEPLIKYPLSSVPQEHAQPTEKTVEPEPEIVATPQPETAGLSEATVVKAEFPAEEPVTPTSAPEPAAVEPTKTKKQLFAEKYPALARRDPEFYEHSIEVMSAIMSSIPEMETNLETTVSTARLTQVFNNIPRTFIDKAVDTKYLEARMIKGNHEYGLSEILILRFLRQYNPELNLDARTRKQLIGFLKEKAAAKIAASKAHSQNGNGHK